MKKRWKTMTLGDVLEVQNGYAFDSKGFNPSTGLPLIRIRSLKAGIETETRFDGDYDKRFIVKAGDLLIGMDGEFGCYEWKGEPALLNQRVCRLQGFNGNLIPRFLLYGVNDYLNAIEDVTGFTTVKHLSSKQIVGIRWFAHAEPFAFDMGPMRYAADVWRMIGGTMAMPAIYSARAGWETVARLGVDRIRTKSLRQTSLLRELHITTTLLDSSLVELTVADTGTGLTDDMRERLFLPYFSTKQRGTGLGLAIAAKIIQEHGGTIRAEKNEPAGARFIVELRPANTATDSDPDLEPIATISDAPTLSL